LTLCIDFDGIFNFYKGYQGPDELFEPADGIHDFLFELSKIDEDIVIFTARDTDKVEEWLFKHGLMQYISSVTNTKIPAILYLDDRAIQFNGDFKETLNEIKEFKVHWSDNQPFKDWEKEESEHGTFNSQTYLEDHEDPDSPWTMELKLLLLEVIKTTFAIFGALCFLIFIFILIINL